MSDTKQLPRNKKDTLKTKPSALKYKIHDYILENPGVNADDIALYFSISIEQVLPIIKQLIKENLVEFDK